MKTALLGAALALVAGCGDDGGVFLDLYATDHFESSKVEIVLASADDAMIALDVKQRVEGADAKVDYYRQRATGGLVATTTIDGFSVKIEPDESVAPDDLFVPIVLVHGPNGDITAIGTVMDEQGALLKMPVRADKPTFYEMNVTPLMPIAHANAAATTGTVYPCPGPNDGDVPSGVVWNPPTGHQLRLLLPIDGSDDASTRKFDIDCDDIAANARDVEPDCDDLDGDTYPGADEECDGIDSACNGSDGLIETTCYLPQELPCGNALDPNAKTKEGIAVCDESAGTGNQLGGAQGCLLPPTCENGSYAHGLCVVPTIMNASDPNKIDSCTAALGGIHVCAGNCTVEVGPIIGDLEVKISNQLEGNYGTETTASAGKVFLRLEDNVDKRPRGTTDVGHVDLVIHSQTTASTFIFPVQFNLNPDAATMCDRPYNGDSGMACSP